MSSRTRRVPGVFITLEGGEGSGKTTWTSSNGYDAVYNLTRATDANGRVWLKRRINSPASRPTISAPSVCEGKYSIEMA